MMELYDETINMNVIDTDFKFELKTYSNDEILAQSNRLIIDDEIEGEYCPYSPPNFEHGILAQICLLLSCYLSELSLEPDNAIELCKSEPFISLTTSILKAQLLLPELYKMDPKYRDLFYLTKLEFISDYLCESILNISKHLCLYKLDIRNGFNFTQTMLKFVHNANYNHVELFAKKSSIEKTLLISLANLSNDPINAHYIATIPPEYLLFELFTNTVKLIKNQSTNITDILINLIANGCRVNKFWRMLLVHDLKLIKALIEIVRNQRNELKKLKRKRLAKKVTHVYLEKSAVLFMFYVVNDENRPKMKRYLNLFRKIIRCRHFNKRIRQAYKDLICIIITKNLLFSL